MRGVPFVCVYCLFFALPAAAQPAEEEPRRLTLHPAAAPVPALRYPLLPDLAVQKHENAVTHYQRASSLWRKLVPQKERNERHEQLDKFRAAPLTDLPREEARAFLKPLAELLEAVDAAALCEHCSWDLSSRLRKQGLETLLGEFQDCRTFVSLLAVRARLELLDGQVLVALQTVRNGFGISRHVGEAPTLICALIGVATSTMMVDVLEDIIQHPKAPSLYWSLTDLPRPLLDFRKPFQGDRLMAYGTFPGLLESATDPALPPVKAEQIKVMADKLILDKETFGIGSRTVLALLLLNKHESSKRALVEHGWPQDKVDALPHLQTALLHSFLEYDRLLDETLKVQTFPHWEADDWFKEADRRVKLAKVDALRPKSDAPALPLAPLLVPATQKVLFARARLDRRIAALRCFEAIRLHASVSKGMMPTSWQEIQIVPVPVDPGTGRPFGYQVESGKATFTAPFLPGAGKSSGYTLSYVLTVKP